MEPATTDMQPLIDAISALREALARLGARVTALEQGLPKIGGTETLASRGPAARTAAPASVDEELLATISAAIAAYLGCKPRIRQIHLIGSSSWSQQGRATIQASHDLRPASARSAP